METFAHALKSTFCSRHNIFDWGRGCHLQQGAGFRVPALSSLAIPGAQEREAHVPVFVQILRHTCVKWVKRSNFALDRIRSSI